MKHTITTGQQFGKLAAIRVVSKRSSRSYWECICSCGNFKVVRDTSLHEGATKSCGCLRKEAAALRGNNGGGWPKGKHRGKCLFGHKLGATAGCQTCLSLDRDWRLARRTRDEVRTGTRLRDIEIALRLKRLKTKTLPGPLLPSGNFLSVPGKRQKAEQQL